MNKNEWRQSYRLFVGSAALVGTLSLNGVPGTAIAETLPVAPKAQLPQIQELNSVFAGLSESLSPTVVNIYTKSKISSPPMFRGQPGMPRDEFEFFFEEPFSGRGGPPGRDSEVQALGSGFIFDTSGYIVTNAHVVDQGGQRVDEVMVKFNGDGNGKGIPAKIIGVDAVTDIAVLKLTQEKSGLKPVVLGDSDRVRVGEWVLAIGNPYGHTHTVTQGIISAQGRSLEGVRSDFLQTSASINPGNSGGPLFNMAGEVIGINMAIDPRAQGIGFAIPVNTAKNVISQLKEKGKVARPWLGVGIQDLSEELSGYMKLKEPKGVLVNEVAEGTPARKAGIEPYDVITKVGSTEVKNSKELIRAIEKLPIGQRTQIEFLRNNKTQSVNVVLGEKPTKAT